MNNKKISTVLFISFCLIWISFCRRDQQCGQDAMNCLNCLGHYTQDGYQPKNFSLMDRWLTILAFFNMGDAFQSCLNKTVVDPSTIYPRSPAECLMAFYQVNQLTGNYSGNVEKFKKNVQIIGKVVFSSYAACMDVTNVQTKVTADCNQHINSSANTLKDYLNDLETGGNGTKYIDKILVTAIQQRALCAVNITFSPPAPIKDDSCKQASREWLYPFISQQMNELKQKKYEDYTKKLHLMYQLAYRANQVCNNKTTSLQFEKNAQAIDEEQVRPIIEMHLRQQNIEVEENESKHINANDIEKHQQS